jgi:glutaredoxin
MVKLIGKQNCSACNMSKTVLKNKGIEFEYFLLNELPQEEQDFYINLAQENNMLSLPLIVVDNKLKTLQEVINN